MRLACVFIPEIALQAALRRYPELRGTPVALVKTSDQDGVRARPPRAATRAGTTHGATATATATAAAAAAVGGALDVHARSPSSPGAATKKLASVFTVSAEARQAGVRPGLTAAQAAATCPGLSLLPLADADLEAADAALVDLGFAFAPRVEREPARIFFEIGDLGQLYPSELAITQAIQARALRIGLGVRVAIAASKSVARVVTRAMDRAVVPSSSEAASAFLAPLPLRVLGEPLPPETAETFTRWGLATLGALAKLPAADLGLRLGRDGACLHRLARGADDEPFLPALPADAVEEGLDLDHAIHELEPLSFVLRGLFDRVLARLACRSLACAAITLRLQLESRAFDVREVNLAAPTRETAPLLQLVRLELTRRPPDAPIASVLVIALPARVRAAQLDFLRPAGPAPDRLAATIARLGALCGPDNVGAPRAENTWREEAVGVTAFALTAGGTGDTTATAAITSGGVRALTIRRYRPAEEIEVMWGPDGPTALRGKETTARILVAAGPYRLSGEWWRREDAEQDRGRTGPSTNRSTNRSTSTNTGTETRTSGVLGFSRDYWDVHASDGALYRLHHDRHHDRWYLDGYYD